MKKTWTGVVVVFGLLGGYVGSYLARTEKHVWLGTHGPALIFRVCKSGQMIKFYKPLADIESRIVGQKIFLVK